MADINALTSWATAASALFAAIALGFNAAALRQANRSRDLEVFDRVFTAISQLEEKLHDAAIAGKGQSSLLPWRSLFLNRLEYFAFLVNSRYFLDDRLVAFFKEAVVRWYEEIFLKLGNQAEKDDPTTYPELKKLYKTFTDQ